MTWWLLAVVLALGVGCGDDDRGSGGDGGSGLDAAVRDGGRDAGRDSGSAPDAGEDEDAGGDGGGDAGVDAGTDAGSPSCCVIGRCPVPGLFCNDACECVAAGSCCEGLLCPRGLVCDASCTCAPPVCEPACEDGDICMFGTCYPACVITGAACPEGEFCTDLGCQPRMCSDDECLAMGLHCDPASGCFDPCAPERIGDFSWCYMRGGRCGGGSCIDDSCGGGTLACHYQYDCCGNAICQRDEDPPPPCREPCGDGIPLPVYRTDDCSCAIDGYCVDQRMAGGERPPIDPEDPPPPPRP